MEFFKANTKIPFMKQRKAAAIFSAVIIVASLLSLAIFRLNLGLDFTGGTQVEVSFTQAANANQLRDNLKKAGFKEAVVQAYGARDFSVRIAPHKNESQDQVHAELIAALPGATVGQLDYIGPQVGQELMTNGILAIIVSLLGTMIYVALRFDWRFAIGAGVALIHDPLLILGVFSLFHLEFNLIVLAAVLTVIGYSLNDTIVVYDRVRENFRKMRKAEPREIMDASINQTLSRTIMTSGLTLLVVIALLLFGGPTLQPFALALMIGIIIGTYSSIYVAGSLAISIGLDHSTLSSNTKPIDDGMP